MRRQSHPCRPVPPAKRRRLFPPLTPDKQHTDRPDPPRVTRIPHTVITRPYNNVSDTVCCNPLLSCAFMRRLS
jgi:hypothetical protein